MKVGFIGLGDQGQPMAEAILEGGFELMVWARRPKVVADFLAKGAQAAASPADLAAQVDHLALCVVSEADCRQILFDQGALAAMQPGSTVVIHATISPSACKDLAEQCAARGVGFLDAPVSGGRGVAQNRKLLIMVGGKPETFARNEAVFSTYGANIHLLGAAGAGQVAKIINNLLMNVNMVAANYALEFGEVLGIDRGLLRSILLTGTSQSFALDALDRVVIPGKIGVVLAEKDLALAAAMAGEHPDTAQAKALLPLTEFALNGRRHLSRRR